MKHMKSRLKGQSMQFVNSPLTLDNVTKAKDSEAICVFISSRVDKNILSKLPKLKLIVTRSTGFDHIDIEECKKRKIRVMNVPSYGENTVAEHAFALILTLSRHVYKSYLRTLSGNFDIEGLKGFDLNGKTLGVVGAGNIGKHVIKIGKGFGMTVVATSHSQDPALAKELGFTYVKLSELLKKSDIVTLHVPYFKENYHMIGKKELRMMKKGALLINTARGELVDTEALLWALDAGILSGAGLDVIEGEQMLKEEHSLAGSKKSSAVTKQLAENHKLIDNEKVVYTPHIAFYSQEALVRILDKTVENLNGFTKKKVDEKAVVC